jgi:hypothetical protein
VRGFIASVDPGNETRHRNKFLSVKKGSGVELDRCELEHRRTVEKQLEECQIKKNGEESTKKGHGLPTERRRVGTENPWKGVCIARATYVRGGVHGDTLYQHPVWDSGAVGQP